MPTIERQSYNEPAVDPETPHGDLDETPELKPRRFQAEWFFIAILIAVPLLVALFGMMGHMVGGVAEQPHPR